MNRAMLRGTLALLVAAGSGWVRAGEPVWQGRVDVGGVRSGVELAPGKISGGNITNAVWLKAPNEALIKRLLTAFFPAATEWKRGFFSFTPDKDGEIDLAFKGAFNEGGAQTWTWVDDIEITGAELVNGDFEKGDASWSLPKREGVGAELVDGSGRGDSRAVRVSHDHYAAQPVRVEAGREVTVAFWFRKAERP